MAKLLSGRPWCWGGIDGCRVENKKPQAAVLPAVLRCLVTPEISGLFHLLALAIKELRARV